MKKILAVLLAAPLLAWAQEHMPDEVETAVESATRDGDVKVVVVRGAGRAFCGGYDFYPDMQPTVWTFDEMGRGVFYHTRALNERFLTVLT